MGIWFACKRDSVLHKLFQAYGDDNLSVRATKFALAPGGVYPVDRCRPSRVSSYLTISPLPVLLRAIGGMFLLHFSVYSDLSFLRPKLSLGALRLRHLLPCCQGVSRLSS
jgi:hypothetical protein